MPSIAFVKLAVLGAISGCTGSLRHMGLLVQEYNATSLKLLTADLLVREAARLALSVSLQFQVEEILGGQGWASPRLLAASLSAGHSILPKMFLRKCGSKSASRLSTCKVHSQPSARTILFMSGSFACYLKSVQQLLQVRSEHSPQHPQ